MKLFLLILLAGALFIFSGKAFAEREINFPKHFDNFPQAKVGATKIINHCWNISKDLRSSPGLDSMTYGQYLTAECFQENYIKLFLMVNIRYDKKTEKELKEQFKKLRWLVIEEIYEDINNIRGVANESVLLSSTSYTVLMQDILSDLIYRIYLENNYYNLSEAIEYLDNFTP